MNDVTKEKTVPLTSVGADDGQSNHMYDDSITDTEEKSNTLEELAKKLNMTEEDVEKRYNALKFASLSISNNAKCRW